MHTYTHIVANLLMSKIYSNWKIYYILMNILKIDSNIFCHRYYYTTQSLI